MVKTKTSSSIAFGKYLMNNYASPKVEFVEGKGATLLDKAGNSYIDFSSGIAVNCLGHNYAPLTRALGHQASKVVHLSNLFMHDRTISSAKDIVKATGMSKVFFCNSGAEANECALKIARKRGVAISKKKFKVISLVGSFHGRLGLALAATGQPKIWNTFGPQPAGFVHVDFNNVSALKRAFDKDVCAAIVEPIQGESGIRKVDVKTLKLLEKLCKANDALLIVDEIQTGMGRTGRLLASSASKIKADLITLGKGIGGGFPLGATLAGKKACDVLQPGDHGTTYGGNPMAMAALEVVFDKVSQKSFLAKVRDKSKLIVTKLEKMKSRGAPIKELRGEGLLIGIVIDEKVITSAALAQKALSNYLLTVPAGENVLRILPPLNVSKKEITDGLRRLEKTMLDG